MSFTSCKSKSWVIDIGATDHVPYTLDNFQTFHYIKPILVKLPDGTTTTATISNTIYFFDKLYLTNVLYIPSFSFDLLFVSNLTKFLHCQFVFTNQTCEIQDCHTLKTIGAAKLKGGLYVLKILVTAVLVVPQNITFLTDFAHKLFKLLTYGTLD